MLARTLPADVQQFVDEQVTKGWFASADDVVVEALRRMAAEFHRSSQAGGWIAEVDWAAVNSNLLDLDDQAWDEFLDEMERQHARSLRSA